MGTGSAPLVPNTLAERIMAAAYHRAWTRRGPTGRGRFSAQYRDKDAITEMREVAVLAVETTIWAISLNAGTQAPVNARWAARTIAAALGATILDQLAEDITTWAEHLPQSTPPEPLPGAPAGDEAAVAAQQAILRELADGIRAAVPILAEQRPQEAQGAQTQAPTGQAG